MNGMQDVGGMTNFGPVQPEPETLRFHADWEKRALGITLAAGAMGVWNLDMTRSARESLNPALYLNSSYYEIWIIALTQQLLDSGLVTQEELEEGRVLVSPIPVPRVLMKDMVEPVMSAGTHYNREPKRPAQFAVGDEVRARNFNPDHHTRLPRYVRGRSGVIQNVHAPYVFPDTHARRQGENPQWVYTVLFTAREIWGEEADDTLTISVEAWESYLETR
ncbi:nitrile hydratase subunit beta [Agrobacterium rubi]|uniref:nitrile hydratase subunit beta n=1 Tax=Agrobacterium rubi TaxID=28099 RepID=UPI001572BF70|nr:nitrile hydratase subunit beta [Agrobacterium rubi]NTF10507.1 nitrile hydratase subunit beta [Agrobacterium rubi]NTF22901.1 nitrile hydratase subunit beta [Agrobacterium rubi]NTF29832.1 nitrile hydratase subunit beta [Agrobacterium rubi]